MLSSRVRPSGRPASRGGSRGARDRSARAQQLELPVRSRGGARPGAGRKPKGARAGVSHLARSKFRRGQPLHVTVRVREGLPTLRSKRTGRLIFAAFASARERLGLRLTHFSIQSNHVHLLVEAADRRALARGMQGLCIRLAKRLNGLVERSGSVFADRYHSRVLKTPLEVRRAVLYVLNNYRKHLAQCGGRAPWDWADPYSSVDYFDGYRPLRPLGCPSERGHSRGSGSAAGTLIAVPDGGERAPPGRVPRAEFALGRAAPVAEPRSWLLSLGWRRSGLLDVWECPGGRGRGRRRQGTATG